MLKTLARLAASDPRIYEIIQDILGRRAAWRRLRQFIPASPGTWLDIGSSTGSFPELDRERSRPVQLDIDIRPLSLLKARKVCAIAVAANAASLPFRSRAFDLSTCFAVSHHLDEVAFRSTLAEVARVTSGQFLFFDAILVESRFMSRLLWRYDRGAFPRTREQLGLLLSAQFEITEQLIYRGVHEYWIAVGKPRSATQ